MYITYYCKLNFKKQIAIIKIKNFNMATSLNYIDDMPPSPTISSLSSGEQVRLSEFGCSGNQVKKNKLLKNNINTIFLAVISK